MPYDYNMGRESVKRMANPFCYDRRKDFLK